MKAALKSPLTITKVSKVVGASLLTKTDLRELLDVPAPLTQNQNVNELEIPKFGYQTKLNELVGLVMELNLDDFYRNPWKKELKLLEITDKAEELLDIHRRMRSDD